MQLLECIQIRKEAHATTTRVLLCCQKFVLCVFHRFRVMPSFNKINQT